VIATLSVPGHKAEPIYCNQLGGQMNPGVQGKYAWLFQCMELANRWVVDSLGEPIIPGGGAKDMCGNANRSAFDVYYGDSAHVPQPGDVAVFSGYTYGHVGVISAVSTTTLTIANQNFGGNGRQYPFITAPRVRNFFGSPRLDGGLRAECIIHPKKLGAPGAISCEPGGAYCGSSSDLPAGKFDAQTLYRCDASGASLSVVSKCANGCWGAPAGHPDRCEEKASSWSCADSRGTNGAQFWTCNVAANGHPSGDGNLYRCEPDGSARFVRCDRGCSAQPLDTNDFCN
jgi:hypothetical protein